MGSEEIRSEDRYGCKQDVPVGYVIYKRIKKVGSTATTRLDATS
jgi:hypothetical protein